MVASSFGAQHERSGLLPQCTAIQVFINSDSMPNELNRKDLLQRRKRACVLIDVVLMGQSRTLRNPLNSGVAALAFQ
jgi:hypothetical protein